jgi:hypothetical protein
VAISVPAVSRRTWLAAALACGCGGGERRLAALLPRSPNGWELAAVQAVAPGAVPPEVAARRPQEAVRAAYRGRSEVTLWLYRMSSAASAFALVQSWRPRENARAFYKGRYFGVAESARDLAEFTTALESALPQ